MKMLLRAALACALLYAVLRDASPSQILRALGEASYLQILPTVGLQLISLYVAAHRWRLLLRAIEPHPPSALILWGENLVGYALNLLPTGALGDLARARSVSSDALAPSASLGVVVTERIVGIVALCAIGLVFSALRPIDAPAVRAADAVAAAIAAAGTLWLLLLVVRPQPLDRLISRLPLALARFARATVPPWPALLRSFLLSVGVQVFAIGAALSLTRAVIPEVGLLDAFHVIPGVALANTFHLTPGNLGQRELSFVWFFTPLGVSAERAIAASAFVVVSMPVFAATGALAYLALQLRRPHDGPSVPKAR